MRSAKLPTAAFVIDHQQRIVQRLEHAAVARCRKPAMNRAFLVEGRSAELGHASTHHKKDRVEDLAQRPRHRPAGPFVLALAAMAKSAATPPSLNPFRIEVPRAYAAGWELGFHTARFKMA